MDTSMPKNLLLFANYIFDGSRPAISQRKQLLDAITFFQNGDTALHIAAAMGRRKLTKILLESGCDKDAKNKQNETAMDISKRKNLGEIISILQNPPPVLSQKDRENQADAARDRSQSHLRQAKSDKKREKTSTSSKENDQDRAGSKRDKKRVSWPDLK